MENLNLSPEAKTENNEINTVTSQPIQQVNTARKSSKKLVLTLIVVIIVLLFALLLFVFRQPARAPSLNTTTIPTKTDTQKTEVNSEAQVATIEGMQLDPKKNYGNKYADGMLPVGDNKSVTTGAKKGYIYQCSALSGQQRGGAGSRGPWFNTDNTKWNVNKKSTISGNVSWKQSLTIVKKDGKRAIKTNGLPNHHTGVFPVQKSDPAYVYDANPSIISAQSLVYTLAAEPTYGAPKCMGMETGIMTTGVALFNGFDASGRDAAAWEVEDSCDGHPQNKGEYHYHSLSRCITEQSVNTVIGYALDGFPITGPKVGTNNILTTDDLDECHGIVSGVKLDNAVKTTYHYVMTQDFPYSASCFRAEATRPPG